MIQMEYVAWETWMDYRGTEKAWWHSKQPDGSGGDVGWSQSARSIGSGTKQWEEGDIGK